LSSSSVTWGTEDYLCQFVDRLGGGAAETPKAPDSKIALALITPTVTTVKTDNGVRIFRNLKSSGDDEFEGAL